MGANVKSKLYSALVLTGISWGAAGAGCSGHSRGTGDHGGRDPEAGGAAGKVTTGGSAGAGGVTGTAGSSGGSSAGTSAARAGASGASGTAGSAGAEGGGTAGAAGSLGGEGGAAEPVAGAGGSVSGASGSGGIMDAGTDAPAPDAFCDETWPTTKGNPAAPPTCEDQAACGPYNDGGFPRWLQCRVRLGDLHCDFLHVTSICENGVWVCPPDGMLPVECRCLGQKPAGMICTEDGFVPVDGGAAGAPG